MPAKKINYKRATGHRQILVGRLTDEHRSALVKICSDEAFASRIVVLASYYAWDASDNNAPPPVEVRDTLQDFQVRCKDLLDRLWKLPDAASRHLRASLGEDVFDQVDTGLRGVAKMELPTVSMGRVTRTAEPTAALALRGVFHLHGLKFGATSFDDASVSNAVRCLQIVFDVSRVRTSPNQSKVLSVATVTGYVKKAATTQVPDGETPYYEDLKDAGAASSPSRMTSSIS